MAKRKEKNENSYHFLSTTSDNYNQVQGWPEWKQSIVISSTTASTGRFIETKSNQKSEK